jgi:uncharacterized membrane protein
MASASPDRPGPTIPEPPTLASALERNIEALAEHRRQESASATLEERIADRITGFAGSMRFVYLHALLFGGWVVINLGAVPVIGPFDPSFVILATVASVEAIFLSTFILISQNRAAALADRRADLDVQISLLAEHEITRLVQLTAAIAERLGIEAAKNPELGELKRDIAPEAVLDRIDQSESEKS